MADSSQYPSGKSIISIVINGSGVTRRHFRRIRDTTAADGRARLRDHYKIADTRVLDAMNKLPRHLFVPQALQAQAYKDNALPIASGQTISQPYIVARMTEILELSRRDKVLEIGAGTGYQTAVLASLSRAVFAVERLPNLAAEARERLKRLSIYNVSLKTDDGTFGWEAYRRMTLFWLRPAAPISRNR